MISWPTLGPRTECSLLARPCSRSMHQYPIWGQNKQEQPKQEQPSSKLRLRHTEAFADDALNVVVPAGARKRAAGLHSPDGNTPLAVSRKIFTSDGWGQGHSLFQQVEQHHLLFFSTHAALLSRNSPRPLRCPVIRRRSDTFEDFLKCLGAPEAEAQTHVSRSGGQASTQPPAFAADKVSWLFVRSMYRGGGSSSLSFCRVFSSRAT